MKREINRSIIVRSNREETRGPQQVGLWNLRLNSILAVSIFSSSLMRICFRVQFRIDETTRLIGRYLYFRETINLG
jgi:hypothetical protein